MPYKSAKELEDLQKELRDITWPWFAGESDSKIWTLKAGTDKEKTGLVYKGHHPKIGTMWKLEAIIDISPEEYFVHFLKNGELVGWTPYLKKYEFLERSEGNDDWNVTYSESANMATISGRDWVSINFHKVLEDGSHYITTIGTEHPKAPKTNLVRGEYLPTAALLKPVKDSPYRCDITFINNPKMNGYVPMSLVNMFMSGFTLEFGSVLIAKAKQMAAERNK